MLKIYDITLDYTNEPSLLRLSGFRFGWKLESDKINVIQTSYQIQIYDKNIKIFDSGVVYSDQSYNITFDSLTLSSGSSFDVTVIVTDNNNNTAQGQSHFSTMLLDGDWNGSKWIKPKEHISGWAPYMRTKFSTKNISSAVMYACGLGCAEYYINGVRTDDYYIDPPIANYEKNVYYRRFDVTSLLRDGGNCLCMLLGEGFYSQSRVWGHGGFVYGDVCGIIKLVITHCDGTITQIVTDTSNWKYKYSPISVNNIYAGEMYDCRLETAGFADYNSPDEGWNMVIEDTTPKGQLTACNIPPVRIIRKLPARSVTCVSGKNDGAWIFDIGENIAGTCEFHLPHSPRGAIYVFRYTEALNAGSNLDHRSIGACATQCIQQDIYIARGTPGGEVYRPHFCYHGFRYIEVTGFHDFSEGYGTMPKVDLVTGLMLSTDFRKVGTFNTSHSDLNKLYNIMDNTYRSNYHGFPEDCPAREKCGWLGDAQVVVNWGLYNYDTVSAYEKYLNDIRTTTEVYGTWLMISPGKRGCGEASPLWGCAQIIIPYYLYKYYGNTQAVTDNWDLMTAWVEHELSRSDDYIISEGLGDWCPPGGYDVSNKNRMPAAHSSTFMFYEICLLMTELCHSLNIGDYKYYSDLAAKIKESAIHHFYDCSNNTFGYQGSDGVALRIGMYPDNKKDQLMGSLLEHYKRNNYAMFTGIYANKYVVPMLFDSGYGDVALRVLFNRNANSFGTMMDDGATSIWEDLDMKSNQPSGITSQSYNHPMHGGFLYFCHISLAGFAPIQPGFKHFEFSPCPATGITEYQASFDSTVGLIKMQYKRSDNRHVYTLQVPANSICTLRLPTEESFTVNGNICNNGDILGSGEYQIILC